MKKSLLLFFCYLLLISFTVAEEIKIVEDLPGKMIFTSKRSSDRNMYIYLLENGKLKNLKIESNMAKISPDGELVAAFVSDNKENDELCLYSLKENKIIKKYSIKIGIVNNLEWGKNNKYIIYGSYEKTGNKNEDGRNLYNKYLMRINIRNGKEKILKKFRDVGFWYDIEDICISPNNKRMLACIGESGKYKDVSKENMTKLYLMNIKGKKIKKLWDIAVPLGWYPDNKHILIHTNNKDWKQINNAFGSLYKLNVDTLEYEVVEDIVQKFYSSERLCPRGKYIYSAVNNPYQVFSLVVGRAGERDKEIMVTFPVPYDVESNGKKIIKYSDDSCPDWWYEGLKEFYEK
ncbi:MAG: hypothetical protein GY830_07860 [Bacteroidetes bacterium]|nr:hypothetical protein [Bacteroidota bacterium]